MIKVCEFCKEEFETTHKNRKCCSRKCSNDLRFPKKVVPCKVCGNAMKLPMNSTKKLCSNECRGAWVSLSNKGKNNPNYKGGTFKVSCANCDRDVEARRYNLFNSDGKKKKNIYCSQDCKAEHQKEILRGENNPNFSAEVVECAECGRELRRNLFRVKTIKSHFCDSECKGKHFSKTMRGSGNPNYIHGLSDEYRLERRFHNDNLTWRKEVYERDGYKCVICEQSYDLNAHHLNSYNWDKSGRVDVSNGVTLCSNHHKDFHKKFGYGNNTKQQFYQYLKTYTNIVVNENITRHRNA